MKRAPRIALAAVLGLVIFAGIAAWRLNALVRYAMTPRVPFQSEAPPPAPDYADPRDWSALPDRADAADAWPPGSPAIDQRRAPADVFYVHPTSHVGRRWNASTGDAALNDATDRVATRIQASAFNNCCAIYAPRYRQSNGTAFTRSSPDGDRAIDLAYGDIKRAFESFNARRGADRPFIIAAHSQGTVLAARLLAESISKTPLRDRLVAAYLIGGAVTVEGLRDRAPDIAPCRAPDDLHCAIAWNARGPEFIPNEFEMHRADPRPLLCTNPLSWRDDAAPAPASSNLGAVFLESADPSPRPAFTDARCAGGILLVHPAHPAPRDLPSRILDRVLGAGNYHPIEYQLFFMNIRENAARRVAAFTRGGGGGG